MVALQLIRKTGGFLREYYYAFKEWKFRKFEANDPYIILQ